MICDEVVERLPWFLNGSLAPEEQSEIRGHLKDCAACRAALAETRIGYRIFSVHVPAEALVDYAWDRTPEGLDSGLVERHLEDCPECAADLEMIRTSRRLAEEPDVALLRPKQRPVVAAAPPRFYRAWQATALAAALGGVVAFSAYLHGEKERQALGIQVASAQQEVAQAREGLSSLTTQMGELRQQMASRPAAPVPSAASAPAETGGGYGTGSVNILILTAELTRGGDEPATPSLSSKSQSAPLIISYDTEGKPAAQYRVEVRRGASPVFSDSARYDENSGGVLFQVNPSKLGKGSYTLVLSAVEGGATKKIQSYRFEIR
ncbi:MAG: zf-HC2 domain-containing protein [Acidobacteriota bacterium]